MSVVIAGERYIVLGGCWGGRWELVRACDGARCVVRDVELRPTSTVELVAR